MFDLWEFWLKIVATAKKKFQTISKDSSLFYENLGRQFISLKKHHRAIKVYLIEQKLNFFL